MKLPSGKKPTKFTVPPLGLTTIYRWAPEWFGDAVEQAGKNGACARRREIVFAVAAAESHLVEWVWDLVDHDTGRFVEYFPQDGFRRTKNRFREVFRALQQDGRLQNNPLLKPSWCRFGKLLRVRNSLVHAASSRPWGGSATKKPFPDRDDLDAMQQGWALDIVRALIGDMHAASGVPLPKWVRSSHL